MDAGLLTDIELGQGQEAVDAVGEERRVRVLRAEALDLR